MWFFISGIIFAVVSLGLIPVPSFNFVTIICLCLGWVVFFNSSRLNLFVCGLFVGCTILFWNIYQYKDASNIRDFLGRDTFVEGIIASPVIINKNLHSFVFRTSKIADQNRIINLKLSFFSNKNIIFYPGQKWRFKVRLQQVVGVSSPGAYDAEFNAIVANINARGYVKHGNAMLLADFWYLYPFMFLQHKLWHNYLQNAENCDHTGVIGALIFGLQSYLPAESFTLFANMGISHLLAISGLHVGMVAGAVSQMFSYVFRVSANLCLLFPAQYFGYLFGGIAAFSYTAIAGFGVPALRSLIMLVIFFFLEFIE